MSEYATETQLISESDYPATGTAGQKWRFLLQYAEMAPSERNTQPWLFQISGTMSELYVDLFADRERAVHQVDPADRELILSCGGALLHLKLALRYFGHAGDIQFFPEADQPSLLARIHFGKAKSASPGEQWLFHAIQKRHTQRQPFIQRPLDSALFSALQKTVEEQSAWLFVVQDEALRESLASYVEEADLALFSNPEFREELARWLRREGANQGDGIPDNVFGMPEQISYVLESFVADADAGKLHAERDKRLALAAPGLVILGTEQDMPLDWLKAGQALAALLLYATAENVSASFLNTPIQVPELRARLTDTFGLQGYPHLILRLGYGEETTGTAGTARRDVSEVLLNERPIGTIAL